MSRAFWKRAVAVSVLTLMATFAPMLAQSASATDATVSWPTDVTLPYADVFAHGDGSFTIEGNDNCSGSYPSGDYGLVSYSPDYSTSYSVLDNGSTATIQHCEGPPAVSSDGTVYYIEAKNASPHTQEIVAVRGSVLLWKQTVTLCGSSATLSLPTYGYSNTVYVEAYGCGGSSTKLTLVALDSGTGAVKFGPVTLPDKNLGTGDLIMPYEDGVAVANGTSDGANIYYYDNSGAQLTSDTFSPSVPTGTTASDEAIAPDGTAYIATYGIVSGVPTYHLYEKLLGSSIQEITIPSTTKFKTIGIYPTPSGGVALLVNKLDGTGYLYLEYFDSSGSRVFENNLSVDSGNNAVNSPEIAVDSYGNVIAVRTISMSASPNDRNVFVDSFSPTGTETRLFDSNAQFGSSGKDLFTTGSVTWASQPVVSNSMANGNLYLILCHQTSGTPSCTTSASPEVVVVPLPEGDDQAYPRSDVFAQDAEQSNYVALGDSFSSGEGNSPFILPSDSDGCDRSVDAYSVLAAKDAPGVDLNLRAFVACSGATSDQIYTGYKGEPGQLSSLDASTDIVSITSGGDDVGFPAFAEACASPTTNCGTSSDAYSTIMGNIDDYLQDNLELLYSRIHTAAPNATIYVMGYPQVAPVSGTSCSPLLDSSEETAARNVVDELNSKISAAVADSDSSVHYADPEPEFNGHELCTSDPFFFGVSIPDLQYSFHPTPDGQEAYAEAFAEALS